MNENKRPAEGTSSGKPAKKKQKKKIDDENNNNSINDNNIDQELSRYPFDKLTELPRRGTKLFGVVDSVEENEKLQQAREHWKDSIQAARTQSKKSLAVAHWNQESKYAEISVEKGKLIKSMGITINSKLCLFPEEAVYLMDQSAMELQRDNLPVSLQEAYSFMLSSGIYNVYGHLRRQGYVVRRTVLPLSSSLSLFSSSPPANFPSYVSPQIVKKLSKQPNSSNSTSNRITTNRITTNTSTTNTNTSTTNTNTTTTNTNTTNTTNTNNTNTTKATNSSTININNEIVNNLNNNTQTLRKCRNWFVKNWEVSTSGECAPITTFPFEESYTVPEVSFPEPDLYIGDELQPLMRVYKLYNEGVSHQEILKQLQIFPTSSLLDASAKNNVSFRFQLFFDIYSPGTGFKKSSPGPPNYRRYNDKPPSLSEQRFLSVLSYPIPILFAVVDAGDVSLFGFSTRQ